MRRSIALIMALICAFCLTGAIINSQGIKNSISNSALFGNGNTSVFDPHREDFSPEIEEEILGQFEDKSEVKKAYLLRDNDWFFSDKLKDFSQAVTTEIIYISPGDKNGQDNSMVYSFYSADQDQKIVWKSSAYPPKEASAPFGFAGLSYEMIDTALDGFEYEDYIITYTQRLNTVFVWVRCSNEDFILTYPTRPDLLGIEIGGIYTVLEIQTALSDAYDG